MYCLNKLMHPEIFQGKNKRKHYFEGWYFKITDSKSEQYYAIIPGISIGSWDTHAFIQVLDNNHDVKYFHFEISDFRYNENRFEIMIGDNYFSRSRIRLNLMDIDFSIQGDLYFCNIMKYPTTFFRKGVMGPFLLLPGMECYHDIINIQHRIIGHLKVSGKTVDFSGGIGYIEKDWGRSMPKTWLWFQSNHFQPDDVSLVFNVAKVPFLGGSFMGFIVMFRYRDRIFMFTTYSGASISRMYQKNDKIKITVQDCRFRLDLSIAYVDGGVIKAPIDGQMSRNITECMNAVVKVRFADRTGKIFYEGIGTNGGLELVEDDSSKLKL